MIYKVYTEKEEIMKTHDRRDTNKHPDLTPYNPTLPPNLYSIPSGSTMQSLANTDLEKINLQQLENIKHSKNICQLYQLLFDQIYRLDEAELTRIANNLKNIEDLNSVNSIIQLIQADKILLQQRGLSDQEIARIIYNGYIPESLSEKECRAAINLIINNSKLLISQLTAMIKRNYTSLNLSISEAQLLIMNLNDDANTDIGFKKIKEIFEDPKVLNKFKLGNNFDFRPIGGACMFLSKTPNIRISQKPSKKLNLIFKYDAIVAGHGMYEDVAADPLRNVNDAVKNATTNVEGLLNAVKYAVQDPNNIQKAFSNIYNILKQYNPANSNFLSNLKKADSDFRNGLVGGNTNFADQKHADDFNKYYNPAIQDVKKLINQIEFANGNRDAESKNWTSEPISTLSQSSLTSVVDILRALKNEGFKNVYICNCNPGGVRMPKDLSEDKDFKYTFGTHNLYLESECDALDSDIVSIYNELCNLQDEVDSYLFTEGKVSEFLKSAAKKARELIKKLWSRLIEIFKNVISSISGKVTKLLNLPNSKKKLEKPIEVNLISFSGNNAKLNTIKCNEISDLKKAADVANNSINITIKNLQAKSNSAIQNIEQHIAMNKVTTNESTLFDNIQFI